MIRKDKHQHALRSLQSIFIQARMLAYESGDKKMSKLLDAAEILPKYMAEPTDNTDIFRLALDDIVDDFPKLSYIIDEFDAEDVPDW